MTDGVKLMTIGSRMLRLLLIAALVMATWSTGAEAKVDHASASSSGPMAAPGERAAGCHAHRTNLYVPPIPAAPRAPVSHRCCLTGHDVAGVPPSSHTPPSEQWRQATLHVVPLPTECSYRGSDVSLALSAYPPGMAPLRI